MSNLKSCRKGLHFYPIEAKRCPECTHRRETKWRQNNKHKVKTIDKRFRDGHKTELREAKNSWVKANPEKVRIISRRHLVKQYGLTEQDYAKMLIQQNSCCAVCTGHQSELKRSLAIDHCHKTGKVRGLLCDDCNLTLGLLKENLNTVVNLLEYLKLHKDNNGL